jgi:hypothetical protein
MANTYCTHCGYKNEYSIHPPKFCGGCGKPLGVLSISKKTSNVVKKKPLTGDDLDDGDDFSDIDYVPNVRGGLKFDIDYQGSGRIIKGSDIIGEINQPNQSGEEN